MESLNEHKHAYCIIAHQDPFLLKTLISLIDDPRNEIFLLFDKKSKGLHKEHYTVKNSRLHIIPFSDSINIRWGGLSQVKAELILFKNALYKSKFRFLHLLSGADLPLRSQNYIHDFFNSIPENTNFVTFSHGDSIEKNVEFKTRYYHPFVEFQQFRKDGNLCHWFQDGFSKTIRKISVTTQKIVNFRRNWKNLEIKKGSNWVTISSDFTKFLVENEDFILNKFKGVICADEIFLHTLLYNSSFKDTIYDYNNQRPSIRKIDWERGSPYVWKKDDFNELIISEAIFARKFSSDKDKEIIEMIAKKIQCQ